MKFRYKILSIFTIAFGLQWSATHANSEDLEQLQNLKQLTWRYRIVLVNYDSQPSVAELKRQLKDQLKAQKAAVNERKLLFITLQDTKVINALSGKQLALSQQELSGRLQHKDIILIGLDGQTKAFYDMKKQFPLQEIFADIDGMPMRRWELK